MAHRRSLTLDCGAVSGCCQLLFDAFAFSRFSITAQPLVFNSAPVSGVSHPHSYSSLYIFPAVTMLLQCWHVYETSAISREYLLRVLQCARVNVQCCAILGSNGFINSSAGAAGFSAIYQIPLVHKNTCKQIQQHRIRPIYCTESAAVALLLHDPRRFPFLIRQCSSFFTMSSREHPTFSLGLLLLLLLRPGSLFLSITYLSVQKPGESLNTLRDEIEP